ncbi:hypothetical protein Pure05_04310 [Paenarthrobacter ureafaciens]|nr:hypothetical protein Pure01_00820 [Paenarthrobacter ureafaciens]GLU62183.1 hypothetical protein Pure02_04330 [Paenarthrobacter ureafaciens]GLU66457.1 hypothetical protein Pure03_04330 [Paenarthrobacter ureafaciens]GLU70370.1 hypothetical protein Pure04_00850 [Paenarthrobacter ureafaciens]GLU74991.1 hypothetical protein Pure05_04310 [Paenarthrobacter ureafaciens]
MGPSARTVTETVCPALMSPGLFFGNATAIAVPIADPTAADTLLRQVWASARLSGNQLEGGPLQ